MSTGLDTIDTEGRTLRGQVLQAVRSALASGTLAPGVRISELGLSASLGVSRGTLREALRRLEQEGLLVTLPHRGTFVRDLSAEEVTHVYGVRFALESYAAQCAAARLTPEMLGTLRTRLDELAAAVDADDFTLGVTADLRFHEAICEASANRFLLDQWRSLVGLIAAVMHTAGPEFLRPLQSIEDHQRLLDSVESRDAGRIRETWRAHFEKGAQTVAKTVRRRHEAAAAATSGERGTSR